MAQPALQQPHVIPPVPAQTVAAGGPIGGLQRTIEARMATIEGVDGMASADEDDVAHRISRIAGPLLLVASYAALAIWLF